MTFRAWEAQLFSPWHFLSLLLRVTCSGPAASWQEELPALAKATFARCLAGRCEPIQACSLLVDRTPGPKALCRRAHRYLWGSSAHQRPVDMFRTGRMRFMVVQPWTKWADEEKWNGFQAHERGWAHGRADSVWPLNSKSLMAKTGPCQCLRS